MCVCVRVRACACACAMEKEDGGKGLAGTVKFSFRFAFVRQQVHACTRVSQYKDIRSVFICLIRIYYTCACTQTREDTYVRLY